MDLDERCPVCGGTICYYINSYGQTVKECSNCKHIIANDVVTTNKTTFTDYIQSTTVTNTSFDVCDYCPYNSYNCEMSYSFCVCKTESEDKQVVVKWLNSEVEE